MKEYRLNRSGFNTKIVLGSGLLSDIESIIKEEDIGQKWILLSQNSVYDLYGKQVISQMRSAGFKIEELIVPQDENAKSFDTVESIIKSLIKIGCNRKTTILALGGGTVGDVSGFIGSIYMRGIKVIQIPTTLLSMVDSSIGGKTAVNIGNYKNIVGTFHQPSKIIIDPSVLKSLDNQSYISGLSEVFKYGIATDNIFFNTLKSQISKILLRDYSCIESIIWNCIKIKSDIVMNDEKDFGERMKLNFGHTFGHAFEVETGFSISHGHAVALGMKCAVALSINHGLSINDSNEIIGMLDRLKFPKMRISKSENILLHIQKDKKSVNGRPQFIRINKIGSSFIKSNISDQEIIEALSNI